MIRCNARMLLPCLTLGVLLIRYNVEFETKWKGNLKLTWKQQWSLSNTDFLLPELYKKILETTLTPAGIDTAKLYPILMSSGLPRETLGQIWALANRTTPGKLTKEELYAVLAMIAVTQVRLTLWRLLQRALDWPAVGCVLPQAVVYHACGKMLPLLKCRRESPPVSSAGL